MSAIRWKVPVTAKIIAVLLSAALAGSTAVVDEVEDMLGDCVKDAAHVRIREKMATEAKKSHEDQEWALSGARGSVQSFKHE